MQTNLREQQRVRTRAGILRVAAEEFDKRGYASVALSEIAARLGVTKGAVYFHFPSKAALARAVVDNYFSVWEALLGEVARRDLRGVSSLRWLSVQVAQSYRDEPGVRAPLRLMGETDAIGIDLPTPFLPWVETVARHVREAQDLGEVRQDIDVETVAWQIVAGFFGAQEISHRLTESADIVERVEAMWDTLLPGIGARNPV